MPISSADGSLTSSRWSLRRLAPVAICWLVLVAAAAAVFAQAVSFEFLDWDDHVNIVANPLLHPVTFGSVAVFWTDGYAGLYVPVTYSLFAVEAVVARTARFGGSSRGLDPRVFHLGNVVLHVLCMLAVFALLRRVSAHNGAACLAALWFGLHPLQVESVSWVTETKGLLAALFSLLAILGYLRFATADAAPTSQRAKWRYYALATVAYLLALLSKPSAVAVPLIAAIFEHLCVARRWTRTFASLIPWVVLACWIAVVTIWEQKGAAAAPTVSPWSRALVASDALSFYIRKIVLPIELGPDYGRTPDRVLATAWPHVAVGLVPLALVVVATMAPPRRVSPAALGIFLAALAPVLGLVPFAYQSFSTVADRYVYMALLGPAVAVAWVLSRHWRWPAMIAAGAVACVFGLASYWQASHWRDNETLFLHALEINSQSHRAHNALGNLFARRGNYDVAAEHYRKALQLSPGAAETHYNLAQLLIRQGHPAEAADLLRRSLELRPGYTKAHLALAGLLMIASEHRQAAQHFEAVLAAYPQSAAAHHGLAQVHLAERRIDEAVQHLRLAMQFDSAWAPPVNNLAWILATTTDDDLRDGREALSLSERLCRGSTRRVPTYIDTLAAAHAELGHYDQAASAAETALALALEAGEASLAQKVRARLALYRSGRPYRE